MTSQSRYVGVDPATGRALEVVVDGAVVHDVRSVTSTDATLPWLTAGLIDLQVNGYGGYDVNGPDVNADAVVAMTEALAEVGTTTFVPTLVTAAEDDIVRSLQAIGTARRKDERTRAAIPYVHVEGPHLSPQDGPRGVHAPEHIREPDVEEFRRWQAASEGLVGMVTISPHHPGSVVYTRHLVAAGTLVAVGHTHATPQDVRAVVDAGASLATHLGNGAHATIARHPNYIWAQLAEDRLTAGFIADGHHLPADTLTAMLRAKGLQRSILVSDSVALAGLPPGEYETPVGGTVVLSHDGRLSALGTPYLAGAATPLAGCVPRLSRLAGLRLGEAMALATHNPARFLPKQGLYPMAGGILPGAPADLIVFDHQPDDVDLTVRHVVAAGRQVR